MAARLFGEALELAEALGDRHLTAALNNALADVLHASGRSAESIESLTRAVGIFSEITADGDEEWIPEVWFLTEW